MNFPKEKKLLFKCIKKKQQHRIGSFWLFPGPRRASWKERKRKKREREKPFRLTTLFSPFSPEPPLQAPFSSRPLSLSLSAPTTKMFFAAEPRSHCDLEFLVPYLAAMSSPSMPKASAKGSAGQMRCAASAATAAAAPARCSSRTQQPVPAQQQKSQQQKQRESQFGAAPSSPRREAPARPAVERNVPAVSSSASPSSAPIVFHHRPPSASSPAHLFSVDLPGRTLSSFTIDVEETGEGAGRLFIDAAAVECGAGRNSFSLVVPRKAMQLSLDLPRDADLSRVSADYEAGVLLLRVPLVVKEAPKRFKVQVGGGGGGAINKRGREAEVEKGEEIEAAAPPSPPSPPPPSASQPSLGAVAAADLSRASLLGEKKNNGDDDEDGSWKAVSSDDDDDDDEDDSDENEKKPSPSAKKRSNSDRKAPSGGAVLEAIEDDAGA